MRKPKNQTARAIRRAAGDYTPVNKAESLRQAPQGRFARSGGVA